MAQLLVSALLEDLSVVEDHDVIDLVEPVFLGDTTCGAERDLGARAALLRLAISQPPISLTGDLPLRLSRIGAGHTRLPA